jgi:hypothetical protein
MAASGQCVKTGSCAVPTGLPRSDSYCASAITPNSWEPRPDNFVANHTVGVAPFGWGDTEIPSDWTAWHGNRDRVSGHFTGTTTEIIQWAACKWGVDEDTIRAVAVQESDWHESGWGDRCNRTSPNLGIGSYGMLAIKNEYCDGSLGWGGFPESWNSTPTNVDFYAAYIRSCYDGDFYDGGSWLYGGQTVAQIAAARGWDYVKWGCVGSWFSGGWYDSGARTYISQVQYWLAHRTWLNY